MIGESQQTATQVLTAAGFQVSVQQESGPTQYANGQVFNQMPGSGSAAKGSTVIIYVQPYCHTPAVLACTSTILSC